MEVKSEREVAQSCPTLSNPMDCSLPGSSIHGIFQTRVLEWGAIAFSYHELGDLSYTGTLKEYGRTCALGGATHFLRGQKSPRLLLWQQQKGPVEEVSFAPCVYVSGEEQ